MNRDSNNERATQKTSSYLVLHREEFTQPRLSPNALVRSYIKLKNEPHRFTHHRFEVEPAGLFSVALVVVEILISRPDVIRLAALRCSDFPLFVSEKRLPDLLHLQGLIILTKSVEQLQRKFVEFAEIQGKIKFAD